MGAGEPPSRHISIAPATIGAALVGNRLIVEIEGGRSIIPVHLAQGPLLAKWSGFCAGFLINGNVSELGQGIDPASTARLGALGGWRFAPHARTVSLSKRHGEKC